MGHKNSKGARSQSHDEFKDMELDGQEIFLTMENDTGQPQSSNQW